MNLETVFIATVGRDNVVAMGWTVWESNPGGGELLLSQLDRLSGLPSLLCNGHRVTFLAVNGRSVALATHSQLAPRLKKE